MIPDNVTLIVKAPNQQIEDQNVECQSSWTVRQLKGHLSEVYPSKPRTEEQKIIYSGQLLDDNIILKDVLRTYETQFAHTMHLVCTPNRMEPTKKPTVPENTEQNELRRRNVDVQDNPRPERQNDQNHTVEMQNYLSSVMNNYGRVPPYPNYNMGEGYLPVNNDPASMANHIMMMQQAYMQYMQQYANMWQNTVASGAVNGAGAATAPGAEAGAAAGGAGGAAAGPANDAGDAGAEGADWLEQVYAASRLALLASLVYLYGSGPRLLLVLLLAAAGYLHQIGFFRDLNLNQRNEGNNGQANQPAQPGNGQPGNGQPGNGQPGNQPGDAQNEQGNQDAQTTEPENNENNQESLLAVTWLIFTTFFTSLIPEAQQ